ncbi:DUF4388 domain-containing protein [Acidobacteria bacterium ACD]|nr:MAG: DUF4388 domain-containing protein [Acidobacteriota bacterium]MCE7957885.1 DUF4388 domain-containing protein [Acidobacteria bacterium ACB2]MDL1949335.1 DUF4388 domain-containing protein [Acidobacteria bacterium ACD]
MALEGTLRDFSLSDILQLISLQRKTGVLTLKSPDDTVALGFDEGKLVSAESAARRMDTRLGTVLVKTRRLSGEQLARALEIQSETLQRLGFILLKHGFCTAEDLRTGLDAQIRKITYALFRWTDGDYVFAQQDHVDYDHEFVTPIGVESLLMEGARMLDEWPIISKVVRSPDVVYQRVPVSQRVVPAEADEHAEEIGESTFERRARQGREEPIRVTRAEWAVYELVDGRRSVGDIVERTFLSDFEGTKAVYELLTRGLIDEVKGLLLTDGAPSVEVPARRPAGSGAVALALAAAVCAVVFLGARMQPRNLLNVLPAGGPAHPVLQGLEKSASLGRLRRLAEAVDSFYLTVGRFPQSLDVVVASRLVSAEEARDPWGRPFRYILQPDKGKYYLVGLDPEGKTDPDLFLSHHVRSGEPVGDTVVKPVTRKEVIVVN